MGTTAWYVADTSFIQWQRASVPGTGGVLPVDVTRLGAEPPWTAWRLERTAFAFDRVERWFLAQLQGAEALLAYVLDGGFASVSAVSSGTVVARLVVGEPAAAEYEGGRRAVEQCAALHGGAWREAALDRLAMWSHLTPRSAAVGTLRQAVADAEGGEGAGGHGHLTAFVLRLFDLLGLPGPPSGG